MYTSERVADGLVKWSEARQVIRGLEAIDFVTSAKRWQDSRAAISAARDLVALMRELADNIETELDGKAGYMDALQEQAHRMTDQLQPPATGEGEPVRCPFCNASIHETETGDQVSAVALTPIGAGYDAECLECGQAWAVRPDDPEWPE